MQLVGSADDTEVSQWADAYGAMAGKDDHQDELTWATKRPSYFPLHWLHSIDRYIYIIGILLIIFYNPHNLHKLRSFIRDIRPLTSLNKQDLFIAHMNVFNGTVEAGKFNMDNWMTKMGTFFE